MILLVALGMTCSAVSAADIWVHSQDRHHKAWTSPNAFSFDSKPNTLGYTAVYLIEFKDKYGNVIKTSDTHDKRGNKKENKMSIASSDKKIPIPENAHRISMTVGSWSNLFTWKETDIPANDAVMVFSNVELGKAFHLQVMDDNGKVHDTGRIKFSKLNNIIA